MLNKKALAASVSAPPAVFVDDVFSTYLYTGNGSTQTITNGIDLAGEGGLVWGKSRVSGTSHELVDTARGGGNAIRTNQAGTTVSTDITGFTSSGFTLGFVSGDTNQPGESYCSWTFRKQPKFFDVVTYTGDGAAERQVNHSLGSAPGMVIVKSTSNSANWAVWHRSLGATSNNMYLNLTSANGANADFSVTGAGTMSSTSFCVSSTLGLTNANGQTYVAYLFAHNAGGFGEAGTDNVISCGSYTGNGSTQSINLGYEPQYILIKSTGVQNWTIYDIMRGLTVSSSNDEALYANTADAAQFVNRISPTATGFDIVSANADINSSGVSYIYMAIRRPMKVPTTGTSVFTPIARTGTNAAANITSAGFTPDLLIGRSRLASTSTPVFVDRLRGNNRFLQSVYTDAEGTSGSTSDVTRLLMNGFSLGTSGGTDLNSSGASEIYYPLRRAPGFMDVVCYTGTGSARTIAHNLTVAPEMVITKARDTAGYDWTVYHIGLGNTKANLLNATAGSFTSSAFWNNNSPTATQFTVGTYQGCNASGTTYVAYLFATCAGVSKVGSYTGDGTDGRVINCGFTSGARFVLIKSTSNTSNWRVWDTARGIVSGNDPFFTTNTVTAEATNSDDIDPSSTGFIVNYNGLSAINESGWEYIFLAIA
jgi:hypothetical protein